MHLKVFWVFLFFFLQYHTWYFVPDDQDKFVMKPTLVVSGVKLHAKSSGGKKRSFVLRAVGEGSTGQMRVYLFYVKIPRLKKEHSFQPIWCFGLY